MHFPKSKWVIKLNDMQYYAYHGLYPIEQKVGQWFSVNVEVEFKADKINSLLDSIDYEVIYRIVHEQMAIPRDLLETVVQDISNNIIAKMDKTISYTKVSIKKIKPLMGKEVGSSEVMMERNFES